MQRKIIAAAIALGISLCATSAGANDKFNRATLGNRWWMSTGSFFLANNELQGTTGAEGFFIDSVLATSATVTVTLHGTGVQYGAITVGSLDTLHAFVKIQSQDGAGMFDHVGFSSTNNGSGPFFTMTPPMASPATMTVSMVGTLALLTVKSATGTQTYVNQYPGLFNGGTGLGTFGPVSLDNFISANPPVPFAATAGDASIQPAPMRESNAVDATR
jgi:hypothetical protein